MHTALSSRSITVQSTDDARAQDPARSPSNRPEWAGRVPSSPAPNRAACREESDSERQIPPERIPTPGARFLLAVARSLIGGIGERPKFRQLADSTYLAGARPSQA